MKTKVLIIFFLIFSSISVSFYLAQKIYQLEFKISSLETILAERDREHLLFDQLKKDYNQLKDEFVELNENLKLKNELKIGNELISFYDAVRYKYGPTGLTEIKYREKDKIKFAVKLALHDLNLSTWSEIENDYYEVTKRHSYEVALKKLKIALSHIMLEDGDPFYVKVDKILMFINEQVKKVDEISDIFRAPTETLSIGSGDNEDFSILAAALFEAAGMEAAIGVYSNELGLAQYVILIHIQHLDDSNLYFYDDLTHLGLRMGKWVLLEPDKTYESQIHARASEFILEAAVELEYIDIDYTKL